MMTTLAPTVLERSPRCFLWRVPVCPLCGREHVHGGGALDGDPRALLGHCAAHCLESAGASYELVEARRWHAEQLTRAAAERSPFQVVGRREDVLSRHRSAAAAHTALGRARRHDPWATAVDVRLMVLAEVLEEMGVSIHA